MRNGFARKYYHFAMTELVTVYKVYTDTGLIGLGENPGPPLDQDVLDTYLGTNPFDHVMGEGRFITLTWRATT